MMKQAEIYLLSMLRDKNSDQITFRNAAKNLSQLLAYRSFEHIKMKAITIDTTLAQTEGVSLAKRIVIIPILRSGITMLEPFLSVFTHAVVGVVGLRRNEITAQADWYYHNIPPLHRDDQIIVIDPMIATGGTGHETLTMLDKLGANMTTALYVSIISCPEGLARLNKEFPTVKIITAACDSHLNDKKFIVPGLGDYGDRYFGTVK